MKEVKLENNYGPEFGQSCKKLFFPHMEKESNTEWKFRIRRVLLVCLPCIFAEDTPHPKNISSLLSENGDKGSTQCYAPQGGLTGGSCRLCSVSTQSFLHLHFRFWPGMAANMQCFSGGWVYLDPQNTIKHIWILCLKVWAMFTSCVLSTFSFIVSRDLTAFQIQDQFDYIILFLIRHKKRPFPVQLCDLQSSDRSRISKGEQEESKGTSQSRHTLLAAVAAVPGLKAQPTGQPWAEQWGCWPCGVCSEQEEQLWCPQPLFLLVGLQGFRGRCHTMYCFTDKSLVMLFRVRTSFHMLPNKLS